MEIAGRVALVTGAASGIGLAVCQQLAQRGVRAIGVVDRSDAVHGLGDSIRQGGAEAVEVVPFAGDVTDESFRQHVYDQLSEQYEVPRICVPAAGITRDSLAAKVDKETGKAQLYDIAMFRLIAEVNLIAPVYWALEMVGRIAQDRYAQGLKRWNPDEGVQGTTIFIGSVSSQGNKGQIAYAATKAGLEGAASTLMKEAIFYGIRCGVIHPGFTDTPMVHTLGEDFIKANILPYTQLGRLIRPDEIAEAICFMIGNSAVSGELWADAGWHPSA